MLLLLLLLLLYLPSSDQNNRPWVVGTNKDLWFWDGWGSHQFKYQKRDSALHQWRDHNNYKWCVEASNFALLSQIGGMFLHDNTRIVDEGREQYQPCGTRTDIGTGTCTKDKKEGGVQLYKC